MSESGEGEEGKVTGSQNESEQGVWIIKGTGNRAGTVQECQRAHQKQLRTRKHKNNQDWPCCSFNSMFSCPNTSKMLQRRQGEGKITLILLLDGWRTPLPKI